MERVIKL